MYKTPLGRFDSPDPFAAVVGDDDLSAYAYVGNRPTVLVDPLGLFEATCPRHRLD